MADIDYGSMMVVEPEALTEEPKLPRAERDANDRLWILAQCGDCHAPMRLSGYDLDGKEITYVRLAVGLAKLVICDGCARRDRAEQARKYRKEPEPKEPPEAGQAQMPF